jgi:hypothetical protein
LLLTKCRGEIPQYLRHITQGRRLALMGRAFLVASNRIALGLSCAVRLAILGSCPNWNFSYEPGIEAMVLLGFTCALFSKRVGFFIPVCRPVLLPDNTAQNITIATSAGAFLEAPGAFAHLPGVGQP